MFKNRCYNGGNQHNFEGRYSQYGKKPDYNMSISGFGDLSKELEKALTDKVYEQDVCTWCGKTLKKIKF